MDNSKINRDYVQAAKRLYATPDGLLVLAYWKEFICNESALADSDRDTFYRLGKKEFVQGVIADLNQDERLLEIAERTFYTGEQT